LMLGKTEGIHEGWNDNYSSPNPHKTTEYTSKKPNTH